jgi:hypothetical protein
MCYAVCYLCVEEDMTVTFSACSDDGIQILVDELGVWTNPVDRAWPGFVDTFTADLHAGTNRLMVKVFDSGGDWNFGVRVRDELGAPIQEGLRVTLDPEGCAGEPPPPTFTRGNVDPQDDLNLTDGIFILQYLFLGGTRPLCLDSADVDDDGQVQLTDALAVFRYLFQGGAEPPPPFLDCGADPTDDDLTCESFPPCG